MTTKSFEVYGDETHLHKKMQYKVYAKDPNEARRLAQKSHPFLIIESVFPSEFYTQSTEQSFSF